MSTAALPTEFDYGTLGDNAAFVKSQTKAIHGLMKSTAKTVIDIGKRLAMVKGRLEHGQFGEWIRHEFDWSHDTVGRFMNVAKRLGDNPQFAEFQPSVLYLLAKLSTPPEALDEALERQAAGETVTVAITKEIIARHRDKPDPAEWTLMSGNYFLRKSVAKIEEKWPAANIEVLGHQLKQIGNEIIEHGGLLK